MVLFPMFLSNRPNARRVTTAWIWLLLLVLGHVSAFGVTVSSGFNRAQIKLGESVTFSINLVGGGADTTPTFPSIPNLRLDGVGKASEIVITGAGQQASVTYTYALTPLQAATYSIPSIIVKAGGAQLPTTPAQLTVLGAGGSPTPPTTPPPQQPPPPQALPAPSPAPPAPQQSRVPEPAFIRLIVPKDEIFVGEIFPVEVQLFFIQGQDIQLPNLRCAGFTVNRMFHVGSTRIAQGNAIYNVFIFKSVGIPIKSGKLEFGPVECNLTVPVRQNPTDQYSQLVLKQMSPSCEAKVMNVLPLPTNDVPPNFNGAVGNFQFTANAGPTNLMVGDPITLRVQIAGRGALDNVLLPVLKEWREFKWYEPVIKLEAPDVLSMAGIKNFEQIIVPQNAEIKEIPALSFSYFDPDQRRYHTLSRPAIPITVRPNLGPAQQPTILTNPLPSSAPTDIVHIKTYPGALGSITTPLLQRSWFIWLQTVPVMLWIILFVRRRQIESLANNPRLRRHLAVQALVAKGLVELRDQASQNKTEEFFASAFRLLQEQLGERLDLPASAITEAIVEERLRPLNVPDEVLAAVQEAFQFCNQARYARERSSKELASLAAHFEKVLAQLQTLGVKGA